MLDGLVHLVGDGFDDQDVRAFVGLPEVVLGLLEVEAVALIAMHEDGERCRPRLCLQLDLVVALDEEEGNAAKLPVPHLPRSSVGCQGATPARIFQIGEIANVPHE